MSNGNPAGANVPKTYLSKQTNLAIAPPGYQAKKFTGKPKVLEWTAELAKGTGNTVSQPGTDTEFGNLN